MGSCAIRLNKAFLAWSTGDAICLDQPKMQPAQPPLLTDACGRTFHLESVGDIWPHGVSHTLYMLGWIHKPLWMWELWKIVIHPFVRPWL